MTAGRGATQPEHRDDNEAGADSGAARATGRTEFVAGLAAALNDEDILLSTRRSLGRPARFLTPRGARLVLSHRYDRPVIFTVNNPDDRIHRVQTKGLFYEQEQLEVMARYMPAGGTFMDVGANVGNHTLYMLLFGGAGRAIPVEPQPEAVSLLISNLMMNGLMERADLRTLGYGLGERSEEGMRIHSPKNNLGWAKLKPADGQEGDGGVPVRAGDDLLGGERIDFLKIDIEGMEIGALNGLERTIATHRPPIFIEVDRHNREAFFDMMKRWNYEPAETFKEGKVNQNFLMRPKD